MNTEIRTMAQNMAKTLLNGKASRVVLVDISDVSIVSEGFLIASGNTSIQVKALADRLDEEMGKAGIHALHTEGYNEGRWIVMDFGDIMVHLFHKEVREFYDIERLWARGLGENVVTFKDEDFEEA